MADMDDEDLLAALEVPIATKSASGLSPEQERAIAGFEDICNFFRGHGRLPSYSEDRDIFERLYAVRLDRLRMQPEFHDILKPLDEFSLLDAIADVLSGISDDDDRLLAELQLDIEATDDDIRTLKHVKPRAEIQAADEIARRIACKDFSEFKSRFEKVKSELDQGKRQTRRFQRDTDIEQGDFFILGGQMAYVASVGEEFRTEQDRPNARLRIIFDNKTESAALLRSFQRALYKDETGRRITDAGAGPLFDQEDTPQGEETGTIYVLRSCSEHPQVKPHRDVIHKIGVTGRQVLARVAGAADNPTFLFANVDIVATYTLYNINRSKLENLLHKFFAAARLDIEIKDRFGKLVKPQEWFVVPLPVIDEVVVRIKDQTIVDYEYDVPNARLKIRAGGGAPSPEVLRLLKTTSQGG
jgi:hypothetical protein